MLNMLQKKLNDEHLTLIADIQGKTYTSMLRGIAPILDPMKENRDFFKDAIVVDKVIGKATAMLLILSQVKYIYAYVMSQKAKEILDMYHVDYDFENLVEYIENRDHTGMCPMEKTVFEIDDLKEGYDALVLKQQELREGKK